jgi:exonuclease SbcC
MPQWSTDNVTPQPVKDIQNLWVTLSGKVESQLHARNVANESYKSNMQIVHDFIGAHPEYTLDRYNELNMISLNEKETIEIELNNTRNRVNIAKSQLNELEKQRNIHLKKTPKDLAEDANLEVYTAEKERLSRERDEMNVEMGIIQAELEFDDNVQKQKAANDIEIKRLESEFEKWKRFDKIYGGDSNGDKLSKIAQSFILGNLLNTANIHLQNMAPRYKLLVNPGTLYLKLEDKYNGFATRSTSSISGGESFLVSLALALALADFGQHLGVSTLFIDEGFGTLSGDALQSAINTLKALHSDAGRQVGIISHREEIRESIPVHIKVKTQPGTSVSTLQVGIRNDDE